MPSYRYNDAARKTLTREIKRGSADSGAGVETDAKGGETIAELPVLSDHAIPFRAARVAYPRSGSEYNIFENEKFSDKYGNYARAVYFRHRSRLSPIPPSVPPSPLSLVPLPSAVLIVFEGVEKHWPRGETP